MTMQLMERSHSPDGMFGWFTYERRNWAASVAVAFSVGYALANGHTTQNAISDIAVRDAQKTAVIKRLQTKDIPALKSLAGCEHVRAQTAVAVAQSVDGDVSNLPKCPPIEVAKTLGKIPPQATKP